MRIKHLSRATKRTTLKLNQEQGETKHSQIKMLEDVQYMLGCVGLSSETQNKLKAGEQFFQWNWLTHQVKGPDLEVIQEKKKFLKLENEEIMVDT